MRLLSSVPARLRRSVALVAGGAVLASAAAVVVASPAQAEAALGTISVDPSTGANETIFGGTVANAACPAGTDYAGFFMEGGDLDPLEAWLGDASNATGTGAQAFSGASVANLKSVTGGMAVAATYWVTLQCYQGENLVGFYETPFTYNPSGTGSWNASLATVPAAPAKPGVSAPTTGGAVKVTWTAPANGGSAISGYVVKGYVGANLAKTVSVGNVLTTTVTGLGNGTTYTFKVAAVNAVGTGAQSVASNAIVPRVATKVVITSAPTLATYGVVAKVIGKLTLSNGTTAVSGQPVILQVRKKGTTTFYSVATVNSTSTGYVTFTTYKPAYPIDYFRLVKSTAGAYLGSVSPAKAVSTQRRITTGWSDSTITLGQTTTLKGYVYPKSSGLRITLQRKSGTSWVTVTYKTLPSTTASYSYYSFAVKPGARGTHYYRVLVSAASNYVTSVGNAPALSVA